MNTNSEYASDMWKEAYTRFTDGAECDVQCETAKKIKEWTDTDEKLQQVADYFRIELDTNRNLDNRLIETFYTEDIVDFAEKVGIEIEKPYLIYLQNGGSKELWGEKAVIDEVKKLSADEQTKGLRMVVCGIHGSEYEGVIKENTYEKVADRIRYEHTPLTKTSRDDKER